LHPRELDPRLQEKLPPNELIDTLVVGADHPILLQAREQWEQENAEIAERPAEAP
jgi:hypothetical protein